MVKNPGTETHFAQTEKSNKRVNLWMAVLLHLVLQSCLSPSPIDSLLQCHSLKNIQQKQTNPFSSALKVGSLLYKDV